MGKVINMIISNDLLFYGIIIFLIVGFILLCMYLHHKKIIGLLEEEIEFTKVEDEKINDSLNTLAEVSNLDSKNEEIEKKINEIDGKVAIEKILNEDLNTSKIEVQKPVVKDVVEEKVETKKEICEEKEIVLENTVDVAPKSELELMLEKMQHDLEEQKDKDAVAIFEQEQEEKSIISYKELLEKKNELMSMTSDERFENETTSLDNEPSLSESFISLTNSLNDTISIDSVKEENTNNHKKFVTTDFISPVFGRMEAQLDYPKVPNFKDLMIKSEKTNEYDLEATLNLDPLTDQIKKDDAFLNALKEFRKNLE